jgi:hypothetical protein
MSASLEIRQQIIRKIQSLPEDKLNSVADFLNKEVPDGSKKTSSYAGCWKDLDESVFDSFTTNLISNRSKIQRRYE